MMQEYISVTYSNSKTWVCPHSWTRPSCPCGKPCQGWGRRWGPWRGRCHRRRRGTSSSPSPPAPAPPRAPASPFLTCLLVSWQKSGMKSQMYHLYYLSSAWACLKTKVERWKAEEKQGWKATRTQQDKLKSCGSWWWAAAQYPPNCNFGLPSSLPQTSYFVIWQGKNAVLDRMTPCAWFCQNKLQVQRRTLKVSDGFGRCEKERCGSRIITNIEWRSPQC